jgi:hypothetical protein
LKGSARRDEDHGPQTIDVKTEKKLASKQATLVPLNIPSLPLSEKPYHRPQSELFSQKMHLKISLLGQGLKVTNYKPGCGVSALHYFVI